MKRIIAVAIIGLLTTPVVYAAKSYVGQCVFPATVKAKDGGLAFKKPVFISIAAATPSGEHLKTMSAFMVKAETATQIQLVTVPDYQEPDPEKNAGKVIGWGQKSDFVFQDLRNCN